MTAFLLVVAFVLFALACWFAPRVGMLLLAAGAAYLTFLAMLDGQVAAAVVMAVNATLLAHLGLVVMALNKPTRRANGNEVPR